VNPSDALSASAQIAVAVAGFAGVVAAFGSQPIREWSVVDRMRLRFLLIGAVLPLLLSLFGLAMLAAEVPLNRAYATCSLVAFLVNGAWEVLGLRAVRRIPRRELVEARWNSPIYATQWSVIGALVLLQAYNAWVLQAFWPFFALIIAQTGSAVVQFIRLVLIRGMTAT
jgi:hypothetical protein